MAPKGKAAAAADDEPPAKRGGSGRGQGRKPTPPAFGAPSKAAKQHMSIADLLGARAPASQTAPGAAAPLAPASAASPAPAPAQAPAPAPSRTAAAPAFTSAQEVGETWHSIIGYGEEQTDEAAVEKLLKENSLIARRVLATD
jgi:hypothetical protein